MPRSETHGVLDWRALLSLFRDEAAFATFVAEHQRALVRHVELEIRAGDTALGSFQPTIFARDFLYYRSFRRVLQAEASSAVAEGDELVEWKLEEEDEC